MNSEQEETKMPQINLNEQHDEHETDVKWLEDPSRIIEDLEHDFRGEEVIELKGQLVWKKTGEPMMNDKGIRFVLSSIRHLTNKNTYLSDVTSQRISDICFETQTNIADTMFLKQQDFGISSEYFQIIVTKISNVIELALRRAQNAGDRRAIMNMSQSITKQEIRNVEPETKKEGLNRFRNY